MKQIFLAIIFVLPVVEGFTQKSSVKKKFDFPFGDPSLSFEKRVNDLVERLTLEEKVFQMMNVAPAIDRLHIPAYDWWNECLHGVARTPYHTTSYPQAIGMAATFDVNSMKWMGDFTAEEGRAINNNYFDKNKNKGYLGLTYWTPNINIFRDPRWGRGQETYGEDPYLTAQLAKAFVNGLQGSDPKYLKAAACAKHFAIHSGPESSRHVFNVEVSDHDLWDTYLPAFRELVVTAKVAGVMCAYNAYGGQPCCANDKLMNEILREQWKFTGYVTSDCGAIDDIWMRHKIEPNAEIASAKAVLHGTDVECGNTSYKSLVQAVKDGKIAEKDLDICLKRLFMIRFRLGMFDPREKVRYARIDTTVLESPAHLALALKMARQSIVLLKNQNDLLPLSKSIKKIAVLGPNADNANTQLGNYNGEPRVVTTVLQGIKEKLAPSAEIIYSRATNFTATDKPDYSKVVDSVREADVIIYVAGISPRLEGEEMKVSQPGFKGGDRTSIMLPETQTDFLKLLKATGKPIVFIMMTGSAIAIPWEDENIAAIMNAWYGGQAAGTAIADVLFGDYNPAGRLPVTFYYGDNDLPPFEDYSMKYRTYRYYKGDVLYPFGFGLSYSTFSYSPISVSKKIVSGKEKISATVTITNKSKRAGEEVAELYVRHENVTEDDPGYALKGFKRIVLQPGASQKVTFTLGPDELKIVDEKGNGVMRPGLVHIFIGGSLPGYRSEALGAAKISSTNVTIK